MIEQKPPIAAALGAVLPASQLLTDPTACAEYMVQGIVPACVAAPASLEELSAVLRAAYDLRAAVTSWGGGTQQQIGAPPARIDLLLRTDRLNRVLVHEPDDLTISVEAGMTLGALRQHLAQFGQTLPIDPPLPELATIGGLIATGADGPRRLGYGTLRDLLIGITVVESTGRVSRGGGMVVKNVSGFDMMKLYLGSYGTLAVIAAANFKLLPAPRAGATIHWTFADSQRAFAFLEELQATQLTPTAAEYLNQAALAQVGLAGASAVLLRAEGLPAAVERHLHDAAAIAARHGATRSTEVSGADETALWSRVNDLPETATLAEDEAMLKLAVLPSETERAIGQLEAWAAIRGQKLAISARALTGVLYARLRPVNARTLQVLARELPGLQWVASRLADAPRWGAEPPGIETMRQIKAEFDPHNMLNAGRFVI